jgi:hypothetical protein
VLTQDRRHAVALVFLGVLLASDPEEAQVAQANARSRGIPSSARSLFTARRSFGSVAANSRIESNLRCAARSCQRSW